MPQPVVEAERSGDRYAGGHAGLEELAAAEAADVEPWGDEEDALQGELGDASERVGFAVDEGPDGVDRRGRLRGEVLGHAVLHSQPGPSGSVS